MNKKCTASDEQKARFVKGLGAPTQIAIMRIGASQDSCLLAGIHNELPIAGLKALLNN